MTQKINNYDYDDYNFEEISKAIYEIEKILSKSRRNKKFSSQEAQEILYEIRYGNYIDEPVEDEEEDINMDCVMDIIELIHKKIKEKGLVIKE